MRESICLSYRCVIARLLIMVILLECSCVLREKQQSFPDITTESRKLRGNSAGSQSARYWYVSLTEFPEFRVVLFWIYVLKIFRARPARGWCPIIKLRKKFRDVPSDFERMQFAGDETARPVMDPDVQRKPELCAS
jgi:hypothetical protein